MNMERRGEGGGGSPPIDHPPRVPCPRRPRRRRPPQHHGTAEGEGEDTGASARRKDLSFKERHNLKVRSHYLEGELAGHSSELSSCNNEGNVQLLSWTTRDWSPGLTGVVGDGTGGAAGGALRDNARAHSHGNNNSKANVVGIVPIEALWLKSIMEDENHVDGEVAQQEQQPENQEQGEAPAEQETQAEVEQTVDTEAKVEEAVQEDATVPPDSNTDSAEGTEDTPVDGGSPENQTQPEVDEAAESQTSPEQQVEEPQQQESDHVEVAPDKDAAPDPPVEDTAGAAAAEQPEVSETLQEEVERTEESGSESVVIRKVTTQTKTTVISSSGGAEGEEAPEATTVTKVVASEQHSSYVQQGDQEPVEKKSQYAVEKEIVTTGDQTVETVKQEGSSEADKADELGKIDFDPAAQQSAIRQKLESLIAGDGEHASSDVVTSESVSERQEIDDNSELKVVTKQQITVKTVVSKTKDEADGEVELDDTEDTDSTVAIKTPQLESSFDANLPEDRTSTPVKALEVSLADIDISHAVEPNTTVSESKDQEQEAKPDETLKQEKESKDAPCSSSSSSSSEDEDTAKVKTKAKKKKKKGFFSLFKRSKESPKKEKDKKTPKGKKEKPDTTKGADEEKATAGEGNQVEEAPTLRIEIGENEQGIDVGDDMERVVVTKSEIRSEVRRTVTTPDGKTYTESSTSKSTDVFSNEPGAENSKTVVVTSEQPLLEAKRADETSTAPVRKESASERVEIFTTNEQPKSLQISIDSSSDTSKPHVASSPSGNSTVSSTQLRLPGDSFDNAVAASTHSSVDSGRGSGQARPHGHFVVVAIDFGTTFSGYAFSFTRDPDAIHMMRKWEGGDPGVINQKTPTTLLMDPEGNFHSFGFSARDFFHDLDPQEAKKWLYFEKFKMTLHYSTNLNKDTTLVASNGKKVSALKVFSYALRFFKDHALQELSDQSSTKIMNEDVRWVITVPAIWKAEAKQFMREAAYQAGIAHPDVPEQLLIALEPEAASIYCRKLRMHQLVPERALIECQRHKYIRPASADGTLDNAACDAECNSLDCSSQFTLDQEQLAEALHSSVYPITPGNVALGAEIEKPGTRYMVVDCGGGTVDITVHEMSHTLGKLSELYKATGGPYGSAGVDMEFEKLLVAIFGAEFIDAFKLKRPAGWVDLMIAFESRKRAAHPLKKNPLNISLPFSFIDYYKKYKVLGSQVESSVRKFGDRDIRWSSQGMLRLTPFAMKRLFLPTVENIVRSIGNVLNNAQVKDIRYMFLVGGFAESPMLQYEVRKEFNHLLKIIIPQDVGLTILKGAVCFGLDPAVVHVRKCRSTYGVGVLNRFVAGKHPKKKQVRRDGVDWCVDVFDKFVEMDDSVGLGDTVLRSYTPAKTGQKQSIINIFSSDNPKAQFITDKGVKKCGSLKIDLSELDETTSGSGDKGGRRELQARMVFGDTEIRVSALDVATGKVVKASIDFLNK